MTIRGKAGTSAAIARTVNGEPSYEVIHQRDVRLVSAEDSLLALIFSLRLSASRRAAAILSWMSLCGDCAMIVDFYTMKTALD